VGSQTLTGIPVLTALRNAPGLNPCSRVWPFETDPTAAPSPATGPLILHAEVWPGILNSQELPQRRCLDEGQVRGLVAKFARLDELDQLHELLAAPWKLPTKERSRMIEEGWILGVPAEPAP